MPIENLWSREETQVPVEDAGRYSSKSRGGNRSRGRSRSQSAADTEKPQQQHQQQSRAGEEVPSSEAFLVAVARQCVLWFDTSDDLVFVVHCTRRLVSRPTTILIESMDNTSDKSDLSDMESHDPIDPIDSSVPAHEEDDILPHEPKECLWKVGWHNWGR